jgi:transcriptional regulator of acetoin/glycerol metabolism
VALREYSYPGNVRELESIIAHAVIMCDSNRITPRDLPENVLHGANVRLALPNYSNRNIPTLQQMEEQLIRSALEKLEWNQTETAKKLGISRSTLWRKMREYNIVTPEPTGSPEAN